MVVEEKNSDFSLSAHDSSLTHRVFGRLTMSFRAIPRGDNVPLFRRAAGL